MLAGQGYDPEGQASQASYASYEVDELGAIVAPIAPVAPVARAAPLAQVAPSGIVINLHLGNLKNSLFNLQAPMLNDPNQCKVSGCTEIAALKCNNSTKSCGKIICINHRYTTEE